MSKKVIYILVATIVLMVFGVYFMSQGKNTVVDSALAKVEVKDAQILPETYDIGKVLMKNGIVTREYQIKNNSQNVLRIKNIVTSCMCTKAQVVLGNRMTRRYGMEMAGAKNPNVNFDIPGNSTATLVVRFDPAAHGIQGVGPIDRSVYLTFLDPIGQKEVKFSGEVVLQ